MEQRTIQMGIDVDDDTGDFRTESSGKQAVLAFHRRLTFDFVTIINRIERISTRVVAKIHRHAFETG